MQCETCFYFDNREGLPFLENIKKKAKDENLAFELGLCRRCVPVVVNKYEGLAVWPVVFDNDWCELWSEKDENDGQ